MGSDLSPASRLFSLMPLLDFQHIRHPQASSGVASCIFLQELIHLSLAVRASDGTEGHAATTPEQSGLAGESVMALGEVHYGISSTPHQGLGIWGDM